jgi:hypothetical protein
MRKKSAKVAVGKSKPAEGYSQPPTRDPEKLDDRSESDAEGV